MTALRALPPTARLLVLGVMLGGAGIAAFRLPAAASWDRSELLAFLGLAAATAVAEQFQIPLVHRRETQNFAVTDGVWTAGLILAAPSVLVLAVAAGVASGQAFRRWSPLKIGFNAGQHILGITVAQLVYEALQPAGEAGPAVWPAAALGMAAFFVVNTGALALVIALAEDKPLGAVLRRPLVLDVLHWSGNVTLGILAAVVWQAERLGVTLLVVPLAMLFVAYRGWFESMRQRDQMNEMARTANAISEQGDLAKRITESGAKDEVGTLAATLNRMLDRLEASFRRERRFISEASHELRTPITICRGHLETLGAGPDPADVEETVHVVVGELGRMGRIVEDLVTLARADDVDFVRPERVAVGPLLADVAAAAGPLLDGRLQVEPVSGPAELDADPQRLTQAILNLLQNAALHGSGTVELRARAEQGVWKFEVSDEGRGLPPSLVETVFDPFTRGGAGAAGSGLGLAIVRGIAEAHGGTVGFENRPGHGVTFWVRVPQ